MVPASGHVSTAITFIPTILGPEGVQKFHDFLCNRTRGSHKAQIKEQVTSYLPSHEKKSAAEEKDVLKMF